MLAATASDNTGGSGLAKVQFQYSTNGGTSWNNAGAALTTAPFNFTFTTALADGSYQARAVATDNAGNTATSPVVSFTIDTVAPTVAMTAPTNGATTTTNEPTLSATASDNTGGSGLANIQFQYSTNGGTTWNNAGAVLATAPFSFNFTTPLPAGTYAARAIATDKAGNSANSPAVSFSVSNASLNVGITAPSGATNNNKPTLSATASETGGTGIASVQFEYSTNGGSAWNNAGAAQTTAPFSYTFTTPLADGSYQVRAVATDKSGNTATTSTVSFMIDTVDPTVAMTAPSDGATTSDTTPALSATASDNTGGSGLATVQFEYTSDRGATWIDAGPTQTSGPFSFTFTTPLADGTYAAVAIATDNAGNQAVSAVVSFTIDTAVSNVLFSDSFDRPYATEDNLGQADNAFGGTSTNYYVPIFAGAVIASGALQSNSAYSGGVEFSTSSNTGATRGTSVGQDLDITVDLLVPTDSAGDDTDAGIFFRSRASFTNDGLLGGTPPDPGGGYWVRLASTGVIQVVDMRNNTVTAFTAQPQSFDATESHTLEVAFHGNDLQVALDDVLQIFNAGGTTVAIPSTGLAGDSTLPGDVSAGNDGCAGLAFGASAGGNSAFGAAAANLIVTNYSSIADLPTDLGTPVSTVNPLPATTTSTNFTVSWTGWPGPGADQVASYNVYISKDGGSFTSFLSHTSQSSATFTGQPGHSYAFYSVATDNLGNVEPTPAGAEATTTIAGPPTSSVNPLPASTTSTNFTVSWGGSPGAGATSIASYQIFVSVDGGPFRRIVSPTTRTSEPFTAPAGHTYGFYSVATNNLGLVEIAPTSAQASISVANPASPPVQPVIIHETAMFQRKLKKGRPVGPAVLTGFSLTFNTALYQAAATNPGYYQLDSVTTKKVKKKTTTILHPITGFTVSYVAATDTVNVNLIGKQTFPTGGRLAVVSTASGGVTGASGGPISGHTVFAISKNGKAITPA